MTTKQNELARKLIAEGYELQPRQYTFQMVLKKGNITIKLG